MQIPDDVAEIGWYRFGAALGSASGSAVLTGHVDDYRQASGCSAGSATSGGDIVKVTEAGSDMRQFSVVAREEWPKSEVSLDRLFDRGGQARLVLMTCGGSFNESTLGYDDNIAVTAVPVKK